MKVDIIRGQTGHSAAETIPCWSPCVWTDPGSQPSCMQKYVGTALTAHSATQDIRSTRYCCDEQCEFTSLSTIGAHLCGEGQLNNTCSSWIPDDGREWGQVIHLFGNTNGPLEQHALSLQRNANTSASKGRQTPQTTTCKPKCNFHCDASESLAIMKAQKWTQQSCASL